MKWLHLYYIRPVFSPHYSNRRLKHFHCLTLGILVLQEPPLRSAYLPYSYVRKDCAHRDAKTSAPPILSLTSSQFVFQESEWWYTVLSLPITLYSLNIPKSCFYTSPYFIVGFPWALLFSLSPFPFGEGWDRESELCGYVYIWMAGGGFHCYLLILL